jgi:hypothetical protein
MLLQVNGFPFWFDKMECYIVISDDFYSHYSTRIISWEEKTIKDFFFLRKTKMIGGIFFLFNVSEKTLNRYHVFRLVHGQLSLFFYEIPCFFLSS